MTEQANTLNRDQLEKAIIALESQRAALGDAVVDAALGPMREKLALLQVGEVPEQQRKIATILFMDIAGHTQIVRDLDPEENMELIDTALARLAAPVSRYGGHIARYQGDGFKAVFGLPDAHENDPEYAIRAGLEILDEARRIGKEMETSWGVESFTVRVGLDTGTIFAGGMTEGEDTIKGNPVNTAARLESAAEPGTLLISHNTYQHVQGVFEFQPLEPIMVKGYDQPIRIYRVAGTKARSFRTQRRGIEGISSQMVGRDKEFTLLKDAFHEITQNGRCSFITISGEPGLGKSRLLYEFESWVSQQHPQTAIFHGRARFETQRLPYSLLRNIFTFLFDIQDNDDLQVMRNKVEEGIYKALGKSDTVQMRAHFVGQLLGFDFSSSSVFENALEDPKQVRDRAFSYMVGYLDRICANTPILMLLEDLHWADESSLELIAGMAAGLRTSPALFIATARQSLYERHPGWMQDSPYYKQIQLTPLTKEANRALVAEILQRVDTIPKKFFDLIITNAEGNPLYTEELIKMLIGDGTINTDESIWKIQADKLTHLHVPETLTGVLQARLDSLEATERTVLQQASVVGRIFWDSVVHYLNKKNSPKPNPAALEAILAALQQKEMVYPRAFSAFTGTHERIFKNTILREVTYESVLLRLRRKYHAYVAEWLIEHSQERVNEFAGLIADHFDQAGRKESALEYLLVAGNQAKESYANNEAVDYFNRALQLLPPDRQETRFEILLSLNLIYDLLGNREAQAEGLPNLEELADKITRKPEDVALRQANVTQRQSKYFEVTGQFEKAALAAEKTVRLAQIGKDTTIEAAGLIRWVVALWRQGFYIEAQERAEQALTLTQEHGVKLYEAHALIQLGNIAWFHNQLLKAANYYERTLSIYQQINYHRGLAAANLNLCLVHMGLDDLPQSESYCNQALTQFELIGDTQGIAQSYSFLGAIANARWQFKTALSHYESTRQLLERINDPNQFSILLSKIGRVSLVSGDIQTAKKNIQQSLDITKDLGNRRSHCLDLAEIGYIETLEGNYKFASQHLAEAQKLADEIGLDNSKAQVLKMVGFNLLEKGDLPQARVKYEELLSLCNDLEEPTTTLQATTGLARTALAQGDITLAQAYVEKILPVFEQPGSGEDPFWFLNHLTCIQTLAAAGDPRCPNLLERAYDQLCERHELIKSLDNSQDFIENIPWHREIVRLRESRSGSS